MSTIRRITGLRCRFGGEEHSGWLPPNAARPLPTPVEHVVLDLEIVEEGGGGYLLIWSSRDGSHVGDLWFERAEDALRQAAADFGAEDHLWQTVNA